MSVRARRGALLVLLAALPGAGCLSSPSPAPVAADDASTPKDATSPADAAPAQDAAAVVDSAVTDAGSADASTGDSARPDAATLDAGVADASAPDAPALDAGVADASAPDAPALDAGVADASAPDAPALDAGVADASAPDAATLDAGVADASAPDAPALDASIADATLSDSSVVDAAFDATDSGGTGGALQFDGVADLVVLPAAGGGANEAAFTAELWFNTTNPTGSLFEVYGGGGADRFLVVENGAVCFYVYGSPTTLLCSQAATYADGAWHHAAGTLGVMSGMALYIDGALATSSPTPTSSGFTWDTNFRLGYGHTDLNSSLVYFGGKLDDVRVWSIERTAGDIAANYRTHVAGTTPGLQGYWKLDEADAATTAADSTPNGNDGVLTNFTFTPSPWVVPGAF